MRIVRIIVVALTFSVGAFVSALAQGATSGSFFGIPDHVTLGQDVDVDVSINVPGGGIQEGPIDLSILIVDGDDTLVFCSGSIEMTEPGSISHTFSCSVPEDISLGEHPVVISTPFGDFVTPQDLVMTVLGDHDVNGDGGLNIADVSSLIDYIFASGPPPLPATSNGDLSCDGRVNIGDVTKLIERIFADGVLPCHADAENG